LAAGRSTILRHTAIERRSKKIKTRSSKLKATKAPTLFIHGDADGARLDHVAKMFRLKGGEVHGDLRQRSESRLAILPNATHVTLMNKLDVIVAMVNDFLDAPPEKK